MPSKKSIEQIAEEFSKKIKETAEASPNGLVKKVLNILSGQISVFETQVKENPETLLDPSDARLLSSFTDDLIKISKEYRDADIDPLEQFKDMTPEEENDFLLELCKQRGIIKDGNAIIYVKEPDKTKSKD